MKPTTIPLNTLCSFSSPLLVPLRARSAHYLFWIISKLVIEACFIIFLKLFTSFVFNWLFMSYIHKNTLSLHPLAGHHMIFSSTKISFGPFMKTVKFPKSSLFSSRLLIKVLISFIASPKFCLAFSSRAKYIHIL